MSGFEINSVTLSGNLTRDPELRSTRSGTSVCSIRIASNKSRPDGQGGYEDHAGYYSVTIWKGMGEWVANNLRKGDKVVVSGELEWRDWQGQDGQKREAVEIVARSVVPAPRGDGGGGGGGNGFSSRGGGFEPRGTDVPADTSDFAPRSTGARPAPQDDDIPF